MRRCVLAAVAGLIGALAAPVLAQQPAAETPPRTPVVLERKPPPPLPPVPGLEGAAHTLEGVRAGRGNLARWRDGERARLGPFLIENYEANQKAREERQRAVAGLSIKQRRALPPLKLLREGPLLPAVIGYAAHFYVKDGEERVGLGMLIWEDPRSNAGAPSSAIASHRTVGEICGRFSASLEDLAYLGPEWTPALAALEETLRPASSPARNLGIYDVAWFVPPTGKLMERTFPRRALERQKNGTAALSCTITEGPLACTLVSEDPAGWGFGEAALKAASMVEAAPQLPDGSSAIGRPLCLPFTYVMAE